MTSLELLRKNQKLEELAQKQQIKGDKTILLPGKAMPKGEVKDKESIFYKDNLYGMQAQDWRIEQEAPDDTRFTTPVIDGPFPGDPGIGPDSVPTPTEQYYNPVQTIAEAPRNIVGPRMPYTIKGAVDIDSRFIDRDLQNLRKLKGPQLPKFI